jgi:hypothetical protein
LGGPLIFAAGDPAVMQLTLPAISGLSSTTVSYYSR